MMRYDVNADNGDAANDTTLMMMMMMSDMEVCLNYGYFTNIFLSARIFVQMLITIGGIDSLCKHTNEHIDFIPSRLASERNLNLSIDGWRITKKKKRRKKNGRKT